MQSKIGNGENLIIIDRPSLLIPLAGQIFGEAKAFPLLSLSLFAQSDLLSEDLNFCLLLVRVVLLRHVGRAADLVDVPPQFLVVGETPANEVLALLCHERLHREVDAGRLQNDIFLE